MIAVYDEHGYPCYYFESQEDLREFEATGSLLKAWTLKDILEHAG